MSTLCDLVRNEKDIFARLSACRLSLASGSSRIEWMSQSLRNYDADRAEKYENHDKGMSSELTTAVCVGLRKIGSRANASKSVQCIARCKREDGIHIVTTSSPVRPPNKPGIATSSKYPPLINVFHRVPNLHSATRTAATITGFRSPFRRVPPTAHDVTRYQQRHM